MLMKIYLELITDTQSGYEKDFYNIRQDLKAGFQGPGNYQWPLKDGKRIAPRLDITENRLSPSDDISDYRDQYVFAGYIKNDANIIQIGRFLNKPSTQKAIQRLQTPPVIIIIFTRKIEYRDFELFVERTDNTFSIRNTLPSIFFNIKIFQGPPIKEHEKYLHDLKNLFTSIVPIDKIEPKDPYRIYTETINLIKNQENTYQYFFAQRDEEAKAEDLELRKDYLYAQFRKYVKHNRRPRRIFYDWVSILHLSNDLNRAKLESIVECAKSQRNVGGNLDTTVYFSTIVNPWLLSKIKGVNFTERWRRDFHRLMHWAWKHHHLRIVVLDIEWWYAIAFNHHSPKIRNGAIKSLMHVKQGEFSAAVDHLKWLHMYFSHGGYLDLNRFPKGKLSDGFWDDLDKRPSYNNNEQYAQQYTEQYTNIDMMFSSAHHPQTPIHALDLISEHHHKTALQLLEGPDAFDDTLQLSNRGRIPESTLIYQDKFSRKANLSHYDSLKFIRAFKPAINHAKIMSEAGPSSGICEHIASKCHRKSYGRLAKEDFKRYQAHCNSWNTSVTFRTNDTFEINIKDYITLTLESLRRHPEILHLQPESPAYKKLTRNPLYHRKALNTLINNYPQELKNVKLIYFPDCWAPLITSDLARSIWGSNSVFRCIEKPYIYDKLYLFDKYAIKSMVFNKIVDLPSKKPDLSSNGYLNTELRTFKHIFLENNSLDSHQRTAFKQGDRECYLQRLTYCHKIPPSLLPNSQRDLNRFYDSRLPKLLHQKILMDCEVSIRRCSDADFKSINHALKLNFEQSKYHMVLHSPDLLQFNIHKEVADLTCKAFFLIQKNNLSQFGTLLQKTKKLYLHLPWPQKPYLEVFHWLAYVAIFFNNRLFLNRICTMSTDKILEPEIAGHITLETWLASVAISCNSVDSLSYILKRSKVDLNAQLPHPNQSWTIRDFLQSEIIKNNLEGFGTGFKVKPAIFEQINSTPQASRTHRKNIIDRNCFFESFITLIDQLDTMHPLSYQIQKVLTAIKNLLRSMLREAKNNFKEASTNDLYDILTILKQLKRHNGRIANLSRLSRGLKRWCHKKRVHKDYYWPHPSVYYHMKNLHKLLGSDKSKK